jgi:hypothetical protein
MNRSLDARLRNLETEHSARPLRIIWCNTPDREERAQAGRADRERQGRSRRRFHVRPLGRAAEMRSKQPSVTQGV